MGVIRISTDIHDWLKSYATKNHRTVGNAADYLLGKIMEQSEKNTALATPNIQVQSTPNGPNHFYNHDKREYPRHDEPRVTPPENYA